MSIKSGLLIAMALADGMSAEEVTTMLYRTQHEQERALGGSPTKKETQTAPLKAAKQYLCKECNLPMMKTGTGLGHWRCRNKAHNIKHGKAVVQS